MKLLLIAALTYGAFGVACPSSGSVLTNLCSATAAPAGKYLGTAKSGSPACTAGACATGVGTTWDADRAACCAISQTCTLGIAAGTGTDAAKLEAFCTGSAYTGAKKAATVYCDAAACGTTNTATCCVAKQACSTKESTKTAWCNNAATPNKYRAAIKSGALCAGVACADSDKDACCELAWTIVTGTTATSCKTVKALADQTSNNDCATCITDSVLSAAVASTCAACAGAGANCAFTKAGCSTVAGELNKLTCVTAAAGYSLIGTGAAAKATVCTAPVAAAKAGSSFDCADKATGTNAAADSWAVTCAAGYYNKGYVAAVPCTAAVAAIALVKGTCTECTGEQDGCKTGTASNTATTCAGTTGKLKCSAVKDGYQKSAGGVVSKCAMYGWTKTWAAGACKSSACNDGYKVASDACVELVCKKGAVTTGYKATGTVGTTQKNAVPAIIACDDAAGVKLAGSAGTTGNTATAAVAGVASTITEIKAVDATKGTDLGTITCDTGYTAATPGAICKTADGAFTYSGCTKKAAPAAVAQTMIGFVLTIIAMYL